MGKLDVIRWLMACLWGLQERAGAEVTDGEGETVVCAVKRTRRKLRSRAGRG